MKFFGTSIFVWVFGITAFLLALLILIHFNNSKNQISSQASAGGLNGLIWLLSGVQIVFAGILLLGKMFFQRHCHMNEGMKEHEEGNRNVTNAGSGNVYIERVYSNNTSSDDDSYVSIASGAFLKNQLKVKAKKNMAFAGPDAEDNGSDDGATGVPSSSDDGDEIAAVKEAAKSGIIK